MKKRQRSLQNDSNDDGKNAKLSQMQSLIRSLGLNKELPSNDPRYNNAELSGDGMKSELPGITTKRVEKQSSVFELPSMSHTDANLVEVKDTEKLAPDVQPNVAETQLQYKSFTQTPIIDGRSDPRTSSPSYIGPPTSVAESKSTPVVNPVSSEVEKHSLPHQNIEGGSKMAPGEVDNNDVIPADEEVRQLLELQAQTRMKYKGETLARLKELENEETRIAARLAQLGTVNSK
jgi:hypothetical protein